MEKKLWLPTLSHFQNDNGWSGSSGVLCYEIEKPKEETMTVVRPILPAICRGDGAAAVSRH